MFNREPAAVIGAVIAFVTAVVGAVVQYGSLSKETGVLILTIVGAGGALVQAVWTRAKVYSPASVEEMRPEPPQI